LAVLTKYHYSGDKMYEGGVGGACGMNVRKEKYIQGFGGET
jgi:hypothetical protein